MRVAIMRPELNGLLVTSKMAYVTDMRAELPDLYAPYDSGVKGNDLLLSSRKLTHAILTPMDISFLTQLLWTMGQLREREGWTREHLLAYQARAITRLRAYAYTHSPYYQTFHKGLYGSPVRELPVLTKAMLMEHFDELVTDRNIHLQDVRNYVSQNREGKLFLDHYRVTATSGSSGQPGIFLFNTREWQMIISSFARGQEWSGARVSLLKRRRMATVASISPWHMSSQVSASVQSWWTPSIRLPASDPLESIVQRLNDWQPHLLIAYASMARILAEEQRDGRLHISPNQVFVASEVLTAETRKRVKNAWGNEPYNQYGATETADIAAEHHQCRHMHLFEDLLFIEIVDEHYQPVAPGSYGSRILVTSLFSRTLPLIRYELNDSVRLSPDICDSGLPFAQIEGIQGRVEDTLQLPTTNGERVAIQPVVFSAIMDVLPVTGWQVIQESDDSLTVLLSGETDRLADMQLQDQLAQELAAHGALVPHIRTQRVLAIPKTAAGKMPLLKAYRPPQSK